ncbi:MAG: hypothetical protein GTN84_18585 [Hydrogenophaga sp.]|nr:hypothetical protein [Hydrogenophaga sp.]NIN28320.1 hypothetical protein [Hydrogenophaga sp.]NIN29139.1 hypothetical protein [Hydrogenophaga sp.]NIN57455.1 hypothetical protein [Hydrogenophaga sp.]NIO53750.1 hypothetical protein [Hydrogenophaga sp.]
MNPFVFLRRGALLAGVSLTLLMAAPARAQSEASAALSLLPVASVVASGVAASGAAAAVSALPVALSAGGAVLTVKAVEASATGTVYLLERASDGARVSVEVSGRAASSTAIGVGTLVTVSVIGAGVVLSTVGEVLAFIPNELGRALLHNERMTY